MSASAINKLPCLLAIKNVLLSHICIYFLIYRCFLSTSTAIFLSIRHTPSSLLRAILASTLQRTFQEVLVGLWLKLLFFSNTEMSQISGAHDPFTFLSIKRTMRKHSFHVCNHAQYLLSSSICYRHVVCDPE